MDDVGQRRDLLGRRRRDVGAVVGYRGQHRVREHAVARLVVAHLVLVQEAPHRLELAPLLGDELRAVYASEVHVGDLGARQAD